MKIDERLYRDMVDRAFVVGQGRSFSNARPENAAYLMRRFFTHAAATVRMYADNLEALGSTEMIGATLDFLRHPSRRLLVVLRGKADQKSLAEHPLLQVIDEVEPEVCGSAHIYSEGRAVRTDDGQALPSFMTMDTRGYRVELNPDKRIVSASVNDVPTSLCLVRIFDRVLMRESGGADLLGVFGRRCQ